MEDKKIEEIKEHLQNLSLVKLHDGSIRICLLTTDGSFGLHSKNLVKTKASIYDIDVIYKPIMLDQLGRTDWDIFMLANDIVWSVGFYNQKTKKAQFEIDLIRKNADEAIELINKTCVKAIKQIQESV